MTPSNWLARFARRSASAGLAVLVADNATNDCTADGSGRAATRENGASDGTGAGADGGALFLRRHTGTSSQAEQHCCGHCIER
jgi:hypothetical protein